MYAIVVSLNYTARTNCITSLWMSPAGNEAYTLNLLYHTVALTDYGIIKLCAQAVSLPILYNVYRPGVHHYIYKSQKIYHTVIRLSHASAIHDLDIQVVYIHPHIQHNVHVYEHATRSKALIRASDQITPSKEGASEGLHAVEIALILRVLAGLQGALEQS